MKFKVDDEVRFKLNNNWEYGTILELQHHTNLILIKENCSSITNWVYERDVELIEDKKYITLKDIKACNPCNSKEYVDLLESFLEFTEKTGKQATITFESLMKKYPNQQSWISSNLNQFINDPKYTGKFKINDTVYQGDVSGYSENPFSYRKLKIMDFIWDDACKQWLIRVEILRNYNNSPAITYKVIDSTFESNLFSSLSDLKKHWHNQITAIKDIEEIVCNKCAKIVCCSVMQKSKIIECVDFKKKHCNNCSAFYNDYVDCGKCEDKSLWKPKEK